MMLDELDCCGRSAPAISKHFACTQCTELLVWQENLLPPLSQTQPHRSGPSYLLLRRRFVDPLVTSDVYLFIKFIRVFRSGAFPVIGVELSLHRPAETSMPKFKQRFRERRLRRSAAMTSTTQTSGQPQV
jgi:hypothetical protein